MKKFNRNKLQAQVIRRVSREYGAFRKQILKLRKQQIYCQCHRIMFYSVVYEFFLYCEDIRDEIWLFLSDRKDIIAQLMEVYFDNEELQCNTYENIHEILNVYYNEREAYYNEYRQIFRNSCK